MKIHTLFILATTITALVWADKDVSGNSGRQSAVFSNSNSYQLDQQSLGDQGLTRVAHSATPSSQSSFGFGQDVQGKQFGQTGSNSFDFGASGSSAAALSYAPPQKPVGGYPDNSYNPAPSYAPPSVGGYPSSVSSYLPAPPSVGGYPASVQQPKPQYGPSQQPAPQYGQPSGESYAYQYTHYPQQSHHHHHSDYGTEGHSSSHSLFDGDLFSSFGGLGSLGGEEGFSGLGGGAGGPGIAAIAGVKAIKALKGLSIAAKIAKHVLLVKPFIILGLLLLVALPFIILFLPIPVITLAPPTVRGADGTAATESRGSTEQILTSYMTDLTSKVFNAEECLERIICKLPEFPEKYRGKAKGLWEEFGSKYLTTGRVSRGLSAYFEDNSGDAAAAKNRTFKCDQKFKCSNKFFK